MPKRKSIVWKFVDELEGGRWSCPYCQNKYGGGVNRVRNHFLEIPNRGISLCTTVPQHIRELMQWLLDQVPYPNKEDIAWKFVERLGDDKWRCHHCKEEFSGDTTGVKVHLLQVSNGGISICPKVPDTIRKLMMSLLEEAAEEEGGEANVQSSTEPPSHDLLSEAQAEVAEEENRGGNGQSSMDFSYDMTSLLTPGSCEFLQQLLRTQPAGESSSQCEQSLAVSQLQTRMDIDPSRYIEETAVDLQASEATTSAIGPSSSQALVPPQLQSVPHQAINNETSNAQNTTAPSSSCYEQLVNAASLPPRIPSSSPDMNRIEIRNLKRKWECLEDKEADVKEQMEIESAASSVPKKPRILVERWLKRTERARNNIQIIGLANAETSPPKEQVETLTREVEELIEQTLPQAMLIEAQDTKGVPFLVRELTGAAIHRNIESIWYLLNKNHACKLGIYGMGGVGKTTIMMHLYNRLVKDATFDGVGFVTVSQDFSIYKLQSDIWKALKFGVMEDNHEKERAAMLSEKLESKKNCVLILDDVWERLDLEEVGIPVTAGGFKLVLTTRSVDVCHQMNCQEDIKIEPLQPKEAKSLFLEELGSEVAFGSEIKAVIQSIVKECAGLPLALITIARSMRGVTQLSRWKDCLVKLEESGMGQTYMEKVLMKLKFSYDRLGDREVQQCFLSCALYPEDEFIGKLELIELFIDLGLIGGLDTRQKQHDRGLTILTILENVCLLEDYGEEMKMHDLIRDMALNIIGATSMVKARKQLRRIPSEECWMDALERVSLMENDIGEFPLDMSPNCPKLSTLLMNNSLRQVSVIPDSFFKRLRRLEYLNLSGCSDLTELPNSISDLVNLRALLLRECWELRHIPFVGKLTSLRKLDAWGCTNLEEIEGLKSLVNLRYLDLCRTYVMRLPKGTFQRLLKLQYLKVRAPIEEDITSLLALETLQCCFRDADNFNKCVRAFRQSKAHRYNITVHPLKSDSEREGGKYDRTFDLDKVVIIEGWGHAIVSEGGECAGTFIMTPQDVQTLKMWYCNGRTNLAGMGPFTCLEELEIEGGENLRVLWGGQDEEGINIHDSPATTPSPPLFPSLRLLKIGGCPKLKYLFGYGSNFPLPHLQQIVIYDCEEMEGIMATVASTLPCPNAAFLSLEKIFVSRCFKMKRVVESERLPHFPTLREIKVDNCENMEEIIGGPPPNMTIEEILLQSLDVRNCSQMRMLFTHEWLIHLRNIQSIHVERCERMVEMISGAGQSQEGSIISEAGQSQGGSIMTPVTNTSFRSSISLPELTHLSLRDLPQLKSICEVLVTCDSIEGIGVYGCPKLKGIPLQLKLNIEALPYIWVEDEEKWKTLTWKDCPDAQATLQPFLRIGEEALQRIPFLREKRSLPTATELPGKGKYLRGGPFLKESPAAEAGHSLELESHLVVAFED